MYQKLQEMWKKLDQKKSQLQTQKLNSIKIIYANLTKGETLQKTRSDLKKEKVSLNLLSYFLIVLEKAYKRALRVRENAKKGTFLALTPTLDMQKKLTIDELVSIELTKMYKTGQWDYNAQKVINLELKKDEDNQKQVILLALFGRSKEEDEKAQNGSTGKTTISTSEKDTTTTTGNKPSDRVQNEEEEQENIPKVYKETNAIFWVASSHKDSASDHEKYQGKIYYDANYDKRDTRITAYIRKHNLMSVQEVTSKPIWFITRPHCRHYFIHYTYEQIVTGRYHIPTRKIGMKRLATKRIEGIGEERVRTALEYYTNRLNILNFMNKTKSNYILRADIQKCKDLIKKWKQEI